MQKKYLSILISMLIIIIFSSGCGGDTSPVPIYTPTAILPTVQPTYIITDPTPHAISSLTEIEATRVTISAESGGKVTEGIMTVDVPANALKNDSPVEIARVNIKEILSSSRDDINEIYKISTGNKDSGIELQIPATVKIQATNEDAPFIWDGTGWIPLEYTYDPNTREIILNLAYIDEDSDEWDDSGGDLGTRDGPAVIGKGKPKDSKMLTFISSKKRFKMFYNNDQEKAYTESIATTLEEAYDYYTAQGYNKPITSDFQSETDPNAYLIAVYIYPYNDPNTNPGSSTYGIAGTGGTLEINKKLVDPITGKSVCYHELFHLIQFSYDKSAPFYNWFGEATAVCMEYKSINRPQEIYDSNSPEYWDTSIWDNTFDTDSDGLYYYKFPFWSYMVKTYGTNTNILHNIMKSSFSKHNGEEFNNVFKTLFGKDMVTCMNENTEDYYIGGKFYNKNYFYNFKGREPNQPYIVLLEKKSKDPDDSSETFSISRLSTKYLCYSSKNFHNTFKLVLSEKSSNCIVKSFYLKNNSSSYSVTQEEITDTKTINNFGTDFSYLFILIENTSINLNATVNIKTIKE